MDLDSDDDAGFQVGRRRASLSSRGSSESPAPKRQKRSFTPTSDDDNLVVPAARDDDTETPAPESVPLIRQAVGFSSINANVSTYQATAAPQPVVPYFLPGQAPLPPPKPKPSKPRAPRQKKCQQFSSQTSKFKLNDSSAGSTTTPRSARNSTSTPAPPRPIMPAASYTFSHVNGSATPEPSNTNGFASDTPQLGSRRAKKSSKRKTPASVDDTFGQQNARARPSVAPGPASVEQEPPRTRITTGGTSVGHTNGSTTATQGPARNVSRPMRMITLLIEDVRSGVPDSQLAEVRVPLKAADDPEDGFWADALEICNALQAGPSRIDGPAKVYTMRGRFRQFFMRVDVFDQLQVQSAHIGISKEKTLGIFIEAPVPQGQLPRPPLLPPEARPVRNVSPDRETMSSPGAMYSRPTYSLTTREDQIERLSKSNYARPERRMSPVSESGSYGHSRRTTSRHDSYASQRPSTSPIPGRLADTEEEKDEAIANYIRSHIENHPQWIPYMQSKGGPQRVSEVLKQYTFVEERVRELTGVKTPAHWDGAPNGIVEKDHVWRALRIDTRWGEQCEETMVLVKYYGEDGSRYEDSRVVGMINDTSPPKENTMDRFIRFLRRVNEDFIQDTLSGELVERQD